MEKHTSKFLLELNGETLPSGDTQAARRFVEFHYFEKMQDAFAALLEMDFGYFHSKITPGNAPGHKCYNAIISDVSRAVMLAEVVRFTPGDNEHDLPFPGIYLQFHDHFSAFESLFDGDLTNMVTYHNDFPYLLLARYKFEEKLQVVNNPGLLGLSKDNFPADMGQDAKPLPWTHRLFFKSFHFADTLTDEYKHDSETKGQLICYTNYYYNDLKTAFADLLKQDFFSFDKELAFDAGMGSYLKQAFIKQRNGACEVDLLLVNQIQNREVAAQQGLYLFFQTSIADFEHKTGLVFNMSAADKGTDALPIARYSTDGQQLEELDVIKPFLSAGNTAHSPEPHGSSQENTPAPYYLTIDWESKSDVSSTTSLKDLFPEHMPFSSKQTAFEALLQLETDWFSPGSRNTQPDANIIQAQIMDTADNRPIWTKFRVGPSHQHLSDGVFIRLHEDKITFESIQITLYHFSAMTGGEGLYFMTGKGGHKTSIQGPAHNMAPTNHQRPQKPPSQRGHTL